MAVLVATSRLTYFARQQQPGIPEFLQSILSCHFVIINLSSVSEWISFSRTSPWQKLSHLCQLINTRHRTIQSHIYNHSISTSMSLYSNPHSSNRPPPIQNLPPRPHHPTLTKTTAPRTTPTHRPQRIPQLIPARPEITLHLAHDDRIPLDRRHRDLAARRRRRDIRRGGARAPAPRRRARAVILIVVGGRGGGRRRRSDGHPLREGLAAGRGVAAAARRRRRGRVGLDGGADVGRPGLLGPFFGRGGLHGAGRVRRRLRRRRRFRGVAAARAARSNRGLRRRTRAGPFPTRPTPQERRLQSGYVVLLAERDAAGPPLPVALGADAGEWGGDEQG